MKPDKIASLREWLRVARAFDHIAESVARDFNDSLDALAAYERVAALLNYAERGGTRITTGELRRALKGTP
jgi:hypothetical protein